MCLECNNHEAHSPTDYHAYISIYATISNTQKQFLHTLTMHMHMYVYHKMYTCNERYFLMFLECNNS